MEKVTELTTEPIVGKFYLVPCVFYRMGWVPVIGKMHTDKELGIAEEHFHYDVRFFKESDMPIACKTPPATTGQTALAQIVYEKLAYQELKIEFMKLKCYRKMPNFKLLDSKSYRRLHQKYVGKDIKCGKCPHRDMPLESLPKDKDGSVICNGHGLKINMISKKVVERYEIS